MAKFGEGDKRWIVEDRADGANVSHWHWVEKDLMEWSRKTLAGLLENVVVMEGKGGCWIRTTKLESVEGEAYVNIRKGKIIPGYELKIRLDWEGEIKDGNNVVLSQGGGKVELPYVSEENHDEVPEIRISAKDNSSSNTRLKEAMYAEGKPEILRRVAEFVKDIRSGGPAKEELRSKSVKKSPSNSGMNGSSATAGGAPAAAAAPQGRKEEKPAEGTKTITMKQKFYCRASDLYATLMDENRWKGFTQSKAVISKEVGGSFSVFDGAITGVHQKLEANKLIIQKWRSSSWAEGHYSTVCITLEEPEEGTTFLKLTQTNVPEEDRFGNATVVESTERGWRDLILNRIKAVFGYGV